MLQTMRARASGKRALVATATLLALAAGAAAAAPTQVSEVVVTASTLDLLGVATTASEGTVTKQELELRQLKRDLRAEAEYVQHIGQLLREADGLRDVLRQLAAEGLDSI